MCVPLLHTYDAACMIVSSGVPATMVGLANTAQTSTFPATPALAKMGGNAIQTGPMIISVTALQVSPGHRSFSTEIWNQMSFVKLRH